MDALDNIFWHALSGPQARHAVGGDTARRFAPGFSPMLAFADLQRPDFGALAGVCQPGETFYCADWSGSMPTGWQLQAEGRMWRMVWGGAPPPDDEPLHEAVPLHAAQHAGAAMELAALCKPGPFGPRTLALGDYLGCFEQGRLIAMAGERLNAGALREVSGICTHPEFQGRGLARRLIAMLLRRQLARGETPFLHVMQDNEGAHRLYQRMGFKDHALAVVRVVSRLG
ncbi:MAG: GNAT family N-acetyltransferase [Pseudomonadota bacterium]